MSRFHYRDPVDPKDRSRYAPWVRELKGRSGVYVIRSKRTKEVLYVGESHTDRLYGTLTRHFQGWNGYSAGERYSAGSVEVAVRVTTRQKAYPTQVATIRRLNPRDNNHHDPDHVPF